MDQGDVELRNITYRLFVEVGRAPTAREVGLRTGISLAHVQEGWRRLDAAHALVLEPVSAEIRMANPFSAVPTPYRVQADGRWWFANCAWDAFGICGALHANGRIETSCPDCGEVITLDVNHERADDESLVFHCLLPARSWWDDIIFT